jgi:hypothetical protein
LLGIMCQEDQYRTAALINDALNIDLALEDYVPFNLKSGKLFSFSHYRFTDDDLGVDYSLIPNLSNFDDRKPEANAPADLFSEVAIDESVRLVKELPKTDYFLILKGEELHLHQYKISDLLKTVPAFLQVQSIEPAELASRRNLIF